MRFATLKRLGHERWFAAVGRRIFPRFDSAVIKLSGGRLRSSENSAFPTLMLTHVGSRTGRIHHTPLLFLRDGDAFVVAGSNWGQKHDPGWALNITANPRARVQVGRKEWDVTARITAAAERERLWTRLCEVWPAYETYAARSGRKIRVFVLEPE